MATLAATIDNATALTADTTISLLQRESAFEDATLAKLTVVGDSTSSVDRNVCGVAARAASIGETTTSTSNTVALLEAAAEATGSRLAVLEATITSMESNISRNFGGVAAIDETAVFTCDKVVLLEAAAETAGSRLEVIEAAVLGMRSSIDGKLGSVLGSVATRTGEINENTASTTDTIALLSAAAEAAGSRLEVIENEFKEVKDAITDASMVTDGRIAEVTKKVSDAFKIATREERDRIRREQVAEEETERRRKARVSVGCGSDGPFMQSPLPSPTSMSSSSPTSTSSSSSLSRQDSPSDPIPSTSGGVAQSPPLPPQLDYRFLVSGNVDGGEYATEVHIETFNTIEHDIKRLRDLAETWWRPWKTATRCTLHRVDNRRHTSENRLSGENTACYGCARLYEP